jgi:hypothetical protein
MCSQLVEADCHYAAHVARFFLTFAWTYQRERWIYILWYFIIISGRPPRVVDHTHTKGKSERERASELGKIKINNRLRIAASW